VKKNSLMKSFKTHVRVAFLEFSDNNTQGVIRVWSPTDAKELVTKMDGTTVGGGPIKLEILSGDEESAYFAKVQEMRLQAKERKEQKIKEKNKIKEQELLPVHDTIMGESGPGRNDNDLNQNSEERKEESKEHAAKSNTPTPIGFEGNGDERKIVCASILSQRSKTKPKAPVHTVFEDDDSDENIDRTSRTKATGKRKREEKEKEPKTGNKVKKSKGEKATTIGDSNEDG